MSVPSTDHIRHDQKSDASPQDEDPDKHCGTKEGESNGPTKAELRAGFIKMRRLEWVTVAYQIGAAALVAALMGGSQAMKTEWMENALAVVPATGALLTYHFENRSQDKARPFGYHRASTVAFAAAAFALATIGVYLFYDSATKLLHHEYPSIGGYTMFGHTFWHGWLMMGVMVFTAFPPMVLARLKIPIAQLLHDKTLFADADMNRANWMTNGSGLIGLILVGLGYWWGDSLAALVISFDIMRDGFTSVAHSLSDVMDRHPVNLETERQDAIVAQAYRALKAIVWVEDCTILMREHGRYLLAEVFVKPGSNAPRAVEATRTIRQTLMALDWRLQHLAVELTDDVKNASAVRTREELDIESDPDAK